MAIITERDIRIELDELDESDYIEFCRIPIDGGEVVAVNGGYIVLEGYVGYAIEAYEHSGIDAWLDAHPTEQVACIHLVCGWDEADKLLDEWTSKTYADYVA